MNKRFFCLVHDQARKLAAECCLTSPDGYTVTVAEPTRTLDQNAEMWPILHCFSEQLEWPVNGRMVKMTPEEWKDVLSAAFRKEIVRLAMGLDGGMVMLGQRTSKFSKKGWSEWREFLYATAADRGVMTPPPKARGS